MSVILPSINVNLVSEQQDVFKHPIYTMTPPWYQVFSNFTTLLNQTAAIIAVPAGGDLTGFYPTLSIATNAVSNSKFRQSAAHTLVGNATASLANVTDITLGSTLSFSGSAIQTAALTGDVTASANSFSTAVGKIKGVPLGTVTATSGYAFIADGTNWNGVAISGVISVSSTGVTAFAATIGTASGGTGLTSYAQGDIIYASATNTLSALAKSATATRYLSNTGTSNNPAWGQINLANGVTGQLPYANTTGVAASGANGDITSFTSLSGSLRAPTNVLDSNGHIVLAFTGVGSAVNYLSLSNNVTAGAPVFTAAGTDTDINLQFNPKGMGITTFYSTSTSPFFMGSGTAYQHGTYFNFPNTAAAQVVTFPDDTGTIVFDMSGTFTPTVTLVGGAGNTVPVYSTNTGRYKRHGTKVFVEIYLTGDGGAEGAGSGQLNIALPVTASGSNPAGFIVAGTIINSTATNVLVGSIAASGTTIALSYFNAIGTTTSATGVQQNNTTRSIRLSFNYEI